MNRRTAAGLLLCLALLVAGDAAAEPVRLATTAFGYSAEVEVRGLPRAAAEAAARRALQEIFEISQLSAADSQLPRSVGALNAAAGQGPQPLDGRIANLLLRGLQFCAWSSGAHTPLGGELYRVWHLGREGPTPQPGELLQGLVSAECSRLSLHPERQGGTDLAVGELAEGSVVDPVWMARGFAIDRAAEILAANGVDNAWIEIGPVFRGIGGGADGQGWLLALPPAPGATRPLDQIWLRDQALAIVTRGADNEPPPLLDQRTGVLPRGAVRVVTVTLSAMDAEVLAATLFILDLREGQMHLGRLDPRPSVYWLLGEGNGKPLESTYHWSELRREPRRGR